LLLQSIARRRRRQLCYHRRLTLWQWFQIQLVCIVACGTR
jgi:hypothetical protein